MVAKFGIKNIIFIAIFLWIMIPNLRIYVNRQMVLNNGVEVTAVVTSFVPGSRGVHPRAYVDYDADGIIYHNFVYVKRNKVSQGDDLVILYGSDNPDKITAKDPKLAVDGTSLLVLYVLIYLFGLLLCVWDGWKNIIKARAELKSHQGL